MEARVVHEQGHVLPCDGRSIGEIEVRGPYVTGRYYRVDEHDRFHDGWLRTGDLGTIDELGFVSISDRAKDMIKSGGEWISSVDLEVAIVAHPAVREAAVIGIPHPRWEERPLAIVAIVEGAQVTPGDLQEFLSQSFAKWQIPDQWAFVDQVPRTSVGKYDKKAMRLMHAEDQLEVV
jgi:fatty-acyl-CoA synthase